MSTEHVVLMFSKLKSPINDYLNLSNTHRRSSLRKVPMLHKTCIGWLFGSQLSFVFPRAV